MYPAGALMADLLVVKPRYTWGGLLIVLSGVPVYWYLRRRARRAIAATRAAAGGRD